jgi:flagellar biogenesis protein FliO
MKPKIICTVICTVLLLSLTLLVLGVSNAMAERFPRQLENIRMFGKGETIEFIFSQPYQGQPVQEHGKGFFSLSFSGTGSAKPVRDLRPVEESIYKSIRVIQNRYSTTVTFNLRDQGLDLKQKLSLIPEGKVLRVKLDGGVPVAALAATPDPAEKLLQQMENRIAGKKSGTDAQPAASKGLGKPEAQLAFGDLAGGEFFYSLVSMVIALVIIVAALYGVLYLYNRFFAGRLRRLTGSHAIRQVASFHIGPRQKIVLLDINGEVIACGVTPNQISYITHLGGKGFAGVRPGGLMDGEKENEESRSESPGQQKNSPAEDLREGKGDAVHQFAEVLKQKVRSLKRIN